MRFGPPIWDYYLQLASKSQLGDGHTHTYTHAKTDIHTTLFRSFVFPPLTVSSVQFFPLKRETLLNYNHGVADFKGEKNK